MSISNDYLMHYGVKGMHWGIRKKESGRSVFVSGTVKISDKETPYYRKTLPKEIKKELIASMKKGDRILVGDAPGIDSMVQDFLYKHRHDKVSVYTADRKTRKNADVDRGLNWLVNKISPNGFEYGSREARAEKDKAMTRDSTSGLAIVIPNGSTATRNNIERMRSSGKTIKTFEISEKKKTR